MAQIALNYSAAEINAAIAKINSLVTVIEGSIVQLYNGSTTIYPLTKAEAVFFDDDTSKTLDEQFKKVILSEEELLKRLQGTSESSDPMRDPFKALNAGNYAEMAELLDATVAGGKYRITFGGNTLVELIVCEKYTGDILQSVSGFIELRNYGIDVATEYNTLMRVKSESEIAGVWVWSEWALVAGSDVVSMISNETNRATIAETSLSGDIETLDEKVRGENAEANRTINYPFKRLADINSIDGLEGVLDKLHRKSLEETIAGESQEKQGNFRIRCGGIGVGVKSYFVGYEYDYFAQEVNGPLHAVCTYAEGIGVSDATTPVGNNYYLARTYSPKIKQVLVSTIKGGASKTLKRRCFQGVWGDWLDASNPYITSPLYGGNLLFLGGSFFCNMRAYGNETIGFTGFIENGFKYPPQDYIAQNLGIKHLDNYAIQGRGTHTSFNPSTIDQFNAALAYSKDKGYEYNAVLLGGGINDFVQGVDLGSIDDDVETTTPTFYSCLKKLVETIRKSLPKAKIYFTTPFKSFSDVGGIEAEAFYYPFSKVTNSAGYRFSEYNQAIKDVARVYGIPVLDIFAIQNYDINNFTEYTLSDHVHPNGEGYRAIMPALMNFLAWGVGLVSHSIENELITQIQDLIARVEALENPGVMAEVSSNVLTFTNGAEVETNNLSLTGNNIDIINNNLNII